MLALISPAKTLDYSTSPHTTCSYPKLMDKSRELIAVLKQKSTEEIATLMKLSDKLAQLNTQRYQDFTPEFELGTNAKQAIFAFKGDVYTGLDVESLSEDGLAILAGQLRILSGLYGVLHPFDLMMPYRLEMGTRLQVGAHNNLYSFWGDTISKHLNAVESEEIINLASNEYFKAVDTKALSAKITTIDFKDYKNGTYKTIGIHAKKARGMMVHFMASNGITNSNDLKAFTSAGYAYNADFSTPDTWTFTRKAS